MRWNCLVLAATFSNLCNARVANGRSGGCVSDGTSRRLQTDWISSFIFSQQTCADWIETRRQWEQNANRINPILFSSFCACVLFVFFFSLSLKTVFVLKTAITKKAEKQKRKITVVCILFDKTRFRTRKLTNFFAQFLSYRQLFPPFFINFKVKIKRKKQFERSLSILFLAFSLSLDGRKTTKKQNAEIKLAASLERERGELKKMLKETIQSHIFSISKSSNELLARLLSLSNSLVRSFSVSFMNRSSCEFHFN